LSSNNNTYLTIITIVDARRLGEDYSNNNNNAIICDGVAATGEIKIDQNQNQNQDQQRSLWDVVDNLKYEITQLIIAQQNQNQNQNHRSLGGGISQQHEQQQQQQQRSLYQEWARNDEGMLHWWIWLIIALCIAACLCLSCCCFSVCCLRD